MFESDGPAAAPVNVVEGAAASVSVLCLVHCLALPVLLYLLPAAVGAIFSAPWFHIAAVALVIPAAFAAFWLGYRQHGRLPPPVLAAAGMACLLGALLAGLPEPLDEYLMACGSVVIVIGHGFNWRCRAG